MYYMLRRGDDGEKTFLSNTKNVTNVMEITTNVNTTS